MNKGENSIHLVMGTDVCKIGCIVVDKVDDPNIACDRKRAISFQTTREMMIFEDRVCGIFFEESCPGIKFFSNM